MKSAGRASPRFLSIIGKSSTTLTERTKLAGRQAVIEHLGLQYGLARVRDLLK